VTRAPDDVLAPDVRVQAATQAARCVETTAALDTLRLEIGGLRAAAAATTQAEKIAKGTAIRVEAHAQAQVQAAHAEVKMLKAQLQLALASSTPQKKAAASAVAAAAAAAPAAASARATALDKRLTAALAQASLVLCWRGKHPGQILSRSLTVSAHAQRTLLLLSPITAGF